VTFQDAPHTLAQQLYEASLPKAQCSACHDPIERRQHRVTLRFSWHEDYDYLCPGCWRVIVSWASRFALEQAELPL
jgi:hypothetical protein